MVVMKAQSSIHENTRGNGDPNFIAEMRVVMDELPRQNLTSKENILNIQQRQQEVTPPKRISKCWIPIPCHTRYMRHVFLKVSSLPPWQNLIGVAILTSMLHNQHADDHHRNARLSNEW